MNDMLLTFEFCLENVDCILLSDMKQIDCRIQRLLLDRCDFTCDFRCQEDYFSMECCRMKLVECALLPWNCQYNGFQVSYSSPSSRCISQFELAKWRHRVVLSDYEHENEGRARMRPRFARAKRTILGFHEIRTSYSSKVGHLQSDASAGMIKKHVSQVSGETFPTDAVFQMNTLNSTDSDLFGPYMKELEIQSLCKTL